MIRVVLDVNVLISSVLGPLGFPRRLWLAWQDGHYQLVTSEPIIHQFRAKLRPPRIAHRHALTEIDIAALITILRTQTSLVPITPSDVLTVSGNPEDDAVLATARIGGAAYLVTGDHGLLSRSPHEGIQIVRPRAFWEFLQLGDTATS